MPFTKTYNESFLDNSGFVEIIKGINANTDGLFLNVILVILWVIIYVAGQGKFETLDSMLASSFIVLIVSTALFGAGMAPQNILILPLIIMAGSIIAKFVVRR